MGNKLKMKRRDVCVTQRHIRILHPFRIHSFQYKHRSVFLDFLTDIHDSRHRVDHLPSATELSMLSKIFRYYRSTTNLSFVNMKTK